jgi:hypothetical protein
MKVSFKPWSVSLWERGPAPSGQEAGQVLDLAWILQKRDKSLAFTGTQRLIA